MIPILEDTTIADVLKTFEDYYTKKDYLNALLVLQKGGKEISPKVKHYNLGTVYAKMQNWPMARYHFLLAAKHGQSSRELEQNREVVENNLEVSRLEKPLSNQDYFLKAGLFASEGLLTTIGLLILLVGLWALKQKINAKRVSLFFLLVLAPLSVDWWIKSWSQGIVINSVSIYEGPSGIFAASGELPQGVLVLMKKNGDWDEIIYPSRFRGWVKKNTIKELE